VALPSCATIKSQSSPILQHASSTKRTQAPPTTSSGLQFILNVVGSSRAQTDWVTAKLLEESARRSGVNSPTRPCDGLCDNTTPLLFNASCRTMTHERTSQRPSSISHISFLFLPLPLRL
jgi:hypothetical protein